LEGCLFGLLSIRTLLAARQLEFGLGQPIVSRRKFDIASAQAGLHDGVRHCPVPLGNFPMPIGFPNVVHDAIALLLATVSDT
jgi:hypothetical protein